MATVNPTLNPRSIQYTDDGNIILPLTRGYVAIISPEDADLALGKWSYRAGKNNVGYAQQGIWKDGKTTPRSLHRVIMERIVGRKLQRNELVDHIDTDGLNNTRNNLRIANWSQNSSNSRRRKTKTGYKGVYPKRDKWRAMIAVNKKGYYLGTFDTPEEAYEAYKAAALKYHGEFARFE